MRAFVDTYPDLLVKSGLFHLTIKSGDEEIQFVLTRHAFMGLNLRCATAEAQMQFADLEGAQPIPLRPKRRRS